MSSFRLLLAGAACTAMALLAAPASATIINFDNLGNGVVVSNQYAGVTFSSDPGEVMVTTAQSLGSSLPNFICTAPSSTGLDCTHSVFVDFAGTGVDSLSFLAVGSNNTGTVANINVFTNGAFNSTVNLTGNASPFVPISIDLSAFSNVTRIEIVNNVDAAGLGYDDFTFNGGGNSVPEPATWAMMLTGFAGMGALLRRRRTQPA